MCLTWETILCVRDMYCAVVLQHQISGPIRVKHTCHNSGMYLYVPAHTKYPVLVPLVTIPDEIAGQAAFFSRSTSGCGAMEGRSPEDLSGGCIGDSDAAEVCSRVKAQAG